jgi:hypothetical protein
MAKIPENPTPGRPWGRALRRTPDEIAALSRVTDEDVDRAGALWDKHAPRPIKKLLKGKRRKADQP